MCECLLIADDDPGVAELIRRYLLEHEESRTAHVTICRSMEEVWTFLRAGGKADLMFLDLVLPLDDPPLGAEDTIALIPKLLPFVPRVVVISGYMKYKEPALAAGATDFLSKLGDLDTPMSFFEKVAKYFREVSGPSKAEQCLVKLHDILHPDGPQKSQ
ncbi:MAG: response regulator [Collimonas pratensis]|uniref:response regulator n=1 Tax=Collimonas pratensis TaxID=279113 RepID=UPI003C7664D4